MEVNMVYGTEATKLVRKNDPQTSKDSANKVNSTFLEEMVHKEIKEYGKNGCIADDLLDKFSNFPYSSITARFASLERKGYIECGPEKRMGRSNRGQRVMRSLI